MHNLRHGVCEREEYSVPDLNEAIGEIAKFDVPQSGATNPTGVATSKRSAQDA
jgi:hypothetical protein